MIIGEKNMATYYLIRGNQIVNEIDTAYGDVVAMPVLAGGDNMSLLNKWHALNLMANLNLTAAEALAALGIVDLTAGTQSTVFLASASSVNGVDVTGIVAYHLADVSDHYSLWQVCGQEADLLRLHAQLWEMEPEQLLGLLAVVQEYGVSFHDSAARIAVGMTPAQALARRDSIASYLEMLGHADTAALRAATTEGAQLVGIVEALGYTKAQLWAAMITEQE